MGLDWMRFFFSSVKSFSHPLKRFFTETEKNDVFFYPKKTILSLSDYALNIHTYWKKVIIASNKKSCHISTMMHSQNSGTHANMNYWYAWVGNRIFSFRPKSQDETVNNWISGNFFFFAINHCWKSLSGVHFHWAYRPNRRRDYKQEKKNGLYIVNAHQWIYNSFWKQRAKKKFRAIYMFYEWQICNANCH